MYLVGKGESNFLLKIFLLCLLHILLGLAASRGKAVSCRTFLIPSSSSSASNGARETHCRRFGGFLVRARVYVDVVVVDIHYCCRVSEDPWKNYSLSTNCIPSRHSST